MEPSMTNQKFQTEQPSKTQDSPTEDPAEIQEQSPDEQHGRIDKRNRKDDYAE
jgi:hypothetical protein